MKQAHLLAGAGGGALAATALLLAFAPSPMSSDAPPDTGRLGVLERALENEQTAQRDLAATLDALAARLERMEVRQQRAPATPASAAPAASPATRPAATKAQGGESPLEPAAFQALMTDVLRSSRQGTVSPEDEERFWRAARTTALVDDTIAALEAAVEADPRDADSRLDLADAYVAKLLTVPAGPERGLWGTKAESQWESVVESHPDHWEAQYALAYNYSMYPDFLNKADVAIEAFERALEIQQRSRPAPEHALTYVNLARMYRKQGHDGKAREVLQLGRSRHPDDAGIAEALAGLDK